MYPFFRPILFRLDPERAHVLTLHILRITSAISPARWLMQALYTGPSKPVTAFGLNFENPVGLAAGYDKDALAVRGLASLGFGHIEVGTVTPLPQFGNPKPRLFRLVEDEAIINRMGFPSRGSAFLQRRLNPGLSSNWIQDLFGLAGRGKNAQKRRRESLKGHAILGVNIGKNTATPNEQAVLDYLELLQSFVPLADYLSINVSSPNSVGLRALQGREALEALLTQLHAQRLMEQEKIKRQLPLLVKLAPDLTDTELEDAVDVILRTHMDGIIVTNTTLARDGLKSISQSEGGGLSGSPLRGRSEAMLQKTVRCVDGAIPIVSAGGIMGPEDAKRRLDMGATLIQIYTGLVYRGPGLVKQIAKSL